MVTALHYLHVLLAFAWFGAVFAENWNGFRARRAKDWATRSVLYDVNRGLSAMVALPALLAVGIVGNVFAMQMGYRMGHTPMLMVVDALWLVLLAVTLAMEMPASGALGALAHAAADAATRGEYGEPAGWGRELTRWRTANAVQMLVYAVMLALMIVPWGVVR